MEAARADAKKKKKKVREQIDHEIVPTRCDVSVLQVVQRIGARFVVATDAAHLAVKRDEIGAVDCRAHVSLKDFFKVGAINVHLHERNVSDHRLTWRKLTVAVSVNFFQKKKKKFVIPRRNF